MTLSNPKLFNQKKELISGFDFHPPQKKYYQLDVEIHGVGITLFFSDSRTLEYLQSQIPPSWQHPSVINFTIYFYGQLEFEDKSWGEEESSNCFLEKTCGHELAIQRDFVGIEREANIYFVILSSDIHNGFFNAIRWMLPRKMLAFNKLVLHSSVIVTPQGRANIFLGHSGAGKTTLTTFAQDRVILGDDMNILAWSEGKYYIQAGGIGGRTDTTAVIDKSYSIESFFWIEQSDFTSVNIMEPSMAALKFMASCPNLFLNYESSSIGDDIMKIAVDVARKYPFKKLKFNLSSEFLNYVEAQ